MKETQTHLAQSIMWLGPSGDTANHPAALVVLARGFLDAAERLVPFCPSPAPNAQWTYQELGSPILFLLRHSIELTLKGILKALRRRGLHRPSEKYPGIEDTSHSLGVLLNEIDALRPSLVPESLRHAVAVFHDIDRQSFGFRYPTEKQSGAPTAATWIFDVPSVIAHVAPARNEIRGRIVLEILAEVDAAEAEATRALISVLGV